MSKKGASTIIELVLAIMFLSILVVAMLFVSGKNIVNINSAVNSENAHYVCNTNLMNFLNAESEEGTTYYELLKIAYIENASSTFSGPANRMMDQVLEDRWNMNVYSYSLLRMNELDEDGEPTGYFATNVSQSDKPFDQDNLEICYANLAVPCPIDDPLECMLLLELEVEPSVVFEE